MRYVIFGKLVKTGNRYGVQSDTSAPYDVITALSKFNGKNVYLSCATSDDKEFDDPDQSQIILTYNGILEVIDNLDIVIGGIKINDDLNKFLRVNVEFYWEVV